MFDPNIPEALTQSASSEPCLILVNYTQWRFPCILTMITSLHKLATPAANAIFIDSISMLQMHRMSHLISMLMPVWSHQSCFM
jgi:hypothetical protein